MIPMLILAAGVAGWVACWFAGAYVAGAKHRPRVEGFILGFAFAAIGVLIEALLPAGPEPRGKAKRRRVPTAEYYREPKYDETEDTVGDWLTRPETQGP